MARMRRTYTAERDERAHGRSAGQSPTTPIFVLGMRAPAPRLVEQILASHPEV